MSCTTATEWERYRRAVPRRRRILAYGGAVVVTPAGRCYSPSTRSGSARIGTGRRSRSGSGLEGLAPVGEVAEPHEMLAGLGLSPLGLVDRLLRLVVLERLRRVDVPERRGPRHPLAGGLPTEMLE